MSPETPKRLILLASAQSYRGNPFVTAANKLGLEVVFGQDIPTPMHKASDSELALDYRDIQRSTKLIKKYAEKYPVGAILGLDDSGTLIAASASEAIGLTHNSLEAAQVARDKHLMRQAFEKAQVPSPHFEYHVFSEDIEGLSKQVDYPCVVKPTTLSGSRGVIRANNSEEFVEAVDRLQKILAKERCNEFLVEDYIAGVEVAVEGILDNGQLLALALFDKPDPLEGPFFEETIYVTPSRLPEEAQQAILTAAEQAAAAIGLVNGPIHAELRYNDQGPWLLEVAGRSIGGLCGQTLRFETEATLEELILRQTFGMDLSGAQRKAGADGVMMIPIPEAGLLKKAEGIEAAKQIAGIDEVEITAPLNYPLVPLPEGNSYLGFIFARGATPEEVERALRKAHAELKFTISPEIKLTPAGQETAA